MMVFLFDFMGVFKLKIAVLVGWFIFGCALLSLNIFAPINGQAQKKLNERNSLKSKPDTEIIERFDKQIQQRFLTEPSFGIYRIAPTKPINPHFEQFYPKNDEESASVDEFQNDGWKASIYLFGKRSTPKIVNEKKTDKFQINYRLFDPIPVTFGLKEKNLHQSTKLLKEVKKAFLEFQTPDSLNKNEYAFEIGKWSYVAKPVLASKQSCVQCHQDYVVTEKIGGGKFKFRKRQIGDVNGVLVYGFSRSVK
jgi:hypothetical protein